MALHRVSHITETMMCAAFVITISAITWISANTPTNGIEQEDQPTRSQALINVKYNGFVSRTALLHQSLTLDQVANHFGVKLSSLKPYAYDVRKCIDHPLENAMTLERFMQENERFVGFNGLGTRKVLFEVEVMVNVTFLRNSKKPIVLESHDFKCSTTLAEVAEWFKTHSMFLKGYIDNLVRHGAMTLKELLEQIKRNTIELFETDIKE